MKNEMLVLGLAQAGGNMVEELYNRGFNVIAINTAIDDLDSLDIEKEFKFHIKNATGTAKNRVLSKQLAKSVAKQIVEIINEKYTSMKYIHIISSLAGGTGGGSIAAVSSMLQSVFTDKYISVSAILPSSCENIRLKNNSLEAFTELAAIQNKIGPFFILSNEKVEKFRVNKMHAEVLDDLVNLRSSNKKGSLDSKELEEIMTSKAIILPYLIKETEQENKPVLVDCYAEIKGNAKLTALSLSKNYRQEEINSFETFRGINISSVAAREDDKNYAFYCSLDFNDSAIKSIYDRLKSEVEKMKQQSDTNKNLEIETFDLSLSSTNLNVISNKTNIVDDEIHLIDEEDERKRLNTREKRKIEINLDDFFK